MPKASSIAAPPAGTLKKMEVTIPAGADWDHAAGIDLDDDGLLTEDGER